MRDDQLLARELGESDRSENVFEVVLLFTRVAAASFVKIKQSKIHIISIQHVQFSNCFAHGLGILENSVQLPVCVEHVQQLQLVVDCDFELLGLRLLVVWTRDLHLVYVIVFLAELYDSVVRYEYLGLLQAVLLPNRVVKVSQLKIAVALDDEVLLGHVEELVGLYFIFREATACVYGEDFVPACVGLDEEAVGIRANLLYCNAAELVHRGVVLEAVYSALVDVVLFVYREHVVLLLHEF